jgi:carbamoyl-phosphate synthase large subunit
LLTISVRSGAVVSSLNVLVTAGSRRVPLVRAFQAALRAAGVNGRVVVTDVNPLSPAVHVTDRWYHVPLATAPEYLDVVAAICEIENVRLVVPTIDDELERFGGAAAWLRSRGIHVAVSPETTSRICVDKLATCTYLRARGIHAARTVVPAGLPPDPAFPLFIKPRFGRGGVNAFPVRSAKELAFFTEYVEDAVIQEFLDGPEFTIDVLCDFDHRLLSVVPRERVVVRAGVIDRGRTVKAAPLMALGEAVAVALPFAGAANIQCRMVDGVPIVFEINPRFSGGIPLTIASGADFPRYLVDLALGRRVPPRLGRFRDALWMTSYETAIFVQADQLAGGRKTALLVGDVA